MAAAPTKASPKRGKSRQRRMGPAPFASFEDLSDELESPDEAKRALLPGIREDSATQEEPGVNLLGLYTPSTPRIDISRASSSSQHEESGGSSGGGGAGSPEGRDPLAVAAGLAAGFKEEGTADLRSSTEELDYHGSEQETSQRRRAMHRQQQGRRSADGISSPLLQSGGFRYEADEERKDSEGALLLGVVGRTSRISSVGSAGSAASALSGLSAGSAISGAASSSGMRSPSPHKMLLETSFCGNKPIPTESMEIDDSEAKSDPNVVEKMTDSQKERHREKPDALDLIPKTDKVPEVNGVKEMTSSSSSQSVTRQASATVTGSKSVSSTPSASPKLSRHSLLKKSEESASPVAEEETPSPATSRKSSFTGLFGRRSESGNLLSPESPTVGPVVHKQRGGKGAISAAIGGLRERSRSRSKSREHIEQTGLSIAQNNAMPAAGSPSEPKVKKDSRNKGVFSSFFKKKDKSKKSKSGSSSGAPSIGDTASEGDPLSPDAVSPDAFDAEVKIMQDAIGNVEFTFNDDISYQCSEEAKSDDGISKLVGSASDERANFGDEVFIQKIVSTPIREEEECMKPDADLPKEAPEVHSVEAEHHSSESEREVEYLRAKEQLKEGLEIQEVDHERKGLVLQQDSFEDELPYIPTTLPQERSVALPIKPVRQRNLAEMKTCPIERPRSTTPINPCALEEFLVAASSTMKSSSQDERLRISLPREDSIPAENLPPRSKSPRSTTGSAAFCSWVQFNEDASGSPKEGRKHRMCVTPGDDECGSSSSPPPLPPRGSLSNQWVNFEEIPEKRKTPKKLREVSKNVELGHMKGAHSQRMVYSYVNPEDCKCECHEMSRPVEEREKNGGTKNQVSVVSQVIEDRPAAEGRKDSIVSVGEVARLEVDNLGDRHSYQSDSSCEFPTNYSVDQQDLEISDGLLKPMKPFGMDLDVSSNRSSIISQDEPASPDNGSSNQKELH